MHWDYLESCFLSNFDLDDDPPENDTDEKPSREKTLVNAFKQPVSKLYTMFVQSVIKTFDSFNTFLQAKGTIDSYIVSFYFAFVSLITFKIYPT